MTRFEKFQERFFTLADPTCRLEDDHGMPDVVNDAFVRFQEELAVMAETGEVDALNITAMGMALAVKGLAAMEFCPACEIGHWVDNIHEAVGCADE